MRVLLINPPRSPRNAIYDWAPDEVKPLIHQKLIGPPLGLLTLAGALDRDRHQVRLVDVKGEHDLDPQAPSARELVRQATEQFRPHLAGVTTIASEFPAAMELLDVVKSCDPAILTVAGGLHAVLCPQDFAKPQVDVLYRARAPQLFAQLVDTVDGGGPLEQVPGLWLPAEGGLRPTEAREKHYDIVGADYIRPDRSLVRPWLSTYIVGRAKGPSTYLFTSLGCPFKCTFCSIWPQYDGAFLQRDPESIVAELATLDEYEVVRFSDANTLVNASFVSRLFDLIEAWGIKKTYVMDIRVDAAVKHPKLIEKMARAGLKVVIAGFESFRDHELARYKKKQHSTSIQEAVKVFHQNGILVRGNYVIPPDYGVDDFRALAAFASEHAVALSGYTILTPMPGTAFFEEQKPKVVDHDLTKYNFFNCVLRTRLPLETFYEQVGDLWRIRLGNEVI